jgi:hypothetical protein
MAGRNIASTLGLSQPTVSRAIGALGDEVVRMGAARSIQYALRDDTRADLELPVYGVNSQGQLHALGHLIPVLPEGYVTQYADGTQIHSDGLPWWLFDMRPQGYLGRAFGRQFAQALGLPERISEWSDTHVMRALKAQGADLPGNLLIGDLARQHFLHAPDPTPIAQADRPGAYAELARAAERGEVAGSSAGGEQPKFTAYAQTAHGPHHVIVKFSASDDNPVSERWRDLLLAEHLALQVLADAGMPTATTAILDHGAQRFLESERFDRVGALGRRALHSLTALDAEFAGQGGSWPDVATALARARCITPEAEQGAKRLWAYGHLIGNTDMHGGNLSFIAENAPDGRPFGLAPAYDMTPMAFAPRSSGGLPDELAAPLIGPQVPADIWREALSWAQRFVQALQQARQAGRLSPRFGPCVDALAAHVAQASARIDRLA